MFLQKLRQSLFGNAKTPHTWASELIAVALWLMGAMGVAWALVRIDDLKQAVVVLLVGSTLLVFGWFAARRNSFEARLVAGVLAGAQTVILSLAFSYGLPGLDPFPANLLAIGTFLLSVVVVGLLFFDIRIRAASGSTYPRPPYAL